LQSQSNATTKESKISAPYNSEDWSLRPTPFGTLASSHFPKGARILELGCGAGQNGLGFAVQGFSTVLSDATDSAFGEIGQRAEAKGIANVELRKLDIIEPLPFADSSFGVVYSELVLHYFNDTTMERIMAEISRVLKAEGILACMTNSIKDPEYDESKLTSEGLLELDGLTKRYFSVETFKPFVGAFEPILFDEHGRAPKDDVKSNGGMIEFIGRKK
jgi:ubiquinone/menaquinone biosynthesis C-methylase UbiE